MARPKYGSMTLVFKQRENPDIARGFTLLEVLVAVAIVALGLSGVLATINGMVGSSAYLRDKTLANWVAQNHITELRLQSDWPDLGKSTDDVEMAGQQWRVETEVVSTPVEKLRRLNVSVAYRETPDDSLVTVAAFIGETGATRPLSDWRSGAVQANPEAQQADQDSKPGPDDGGDET